MGPTGPTSSWRPFGPLSALRASFWPFGPANTITGANTITSVFSVTEQQQEQEEYRILGVRMLALSSFSVQLFLNVFCNSTKSIANALQYLIQF